RQIEPSERGRRLVELGAVTLGEPVVAACHALLLLLGCTFKPTGTPCTRDGPDSGVDQVGSTPPDLLQSEDVPDRSAPDHARGVDRDRNARLGLSVCPPAGKSCHAPPYRPP